jgi:hypothetical protein
MATCGILRSVWISQTDVHLGRSFGEGSSERSFDRSLQVNQCSTGPGLLFRYQTGENYDSSLHNSSQYQCWTITQYTRSLDHRSKGSGWGGLVSHCSRDYHVRLLIVEQRLSSSYTSSLLRLHSSLWAQLKGPSCIRFANSAALRAVAKLNNVRHSSSL